MDAQLFITFVHNKVHLTQFRGSFDPPRNYFCIIFPQDVDDLHFSTNKQELFLQPLIAIKLGQIPYVCKLKLLLVIGAMLHPLSKELSFLCNRNVFYLSSQVLMFFIYYFTKKKEQLQQCRMCGSFIIYQHLVDLDFSALWLQDLMTQRMLFSLSIFLQLYYYVRSLLPMLKHTI